MQTLDYLEACRATLDFGGFQQRLLCFVISLARPTLARRSLRFALLSLATLYSSGLDHTRYFATRHSLRRRREGRTIGEAALVDAPLNLEVAIHTERRSPGVADRPIRLVRGVVVAVADRHNRVVDRGWGVLTLAIIDSLLIIAEVVGDLIGDRDGPAYPTASLSSSSSSEVILLTHATFAIASVFLKLHVLPVLAV